MVLRNYSNRFLYSSILVWIVVNAVVVVSYNKHNNNMSGRNSKQRQKHVPPVFTWNDLKYGRRDDELKKVLTTTGLLSIDMNDHQHHNEEALQWLCDCSSELHQLEGGEERPLKDGKTIRSTLASATMGLSHPHPLPHQQLSQLQHCSSTSTKVLETLRDDVSAHSQQFIVALDRLLLQKQQQQQQQQQSSSSSFTTKTAALMENSYGRTYHSVKDIVSKSHNLEHFHVYTHDDHNNNDVKTKDDFGYHQAVDSALSSHMDAGLFLAFVPAMNCHHSSSNDDDSDDDSFHIHHHHHHHSSQPVSFEPGTMAIMLGAGAEYWLSSPLPLKATRHSVQMKSNTKRSWYGMMHLVPSNAIIEKYPEPKTFADMRSSMALTSTNKKQADNNNNNNNGGAVTMGCGIGSPTTTSTSSSREYSPSDSPQRRRVEMVNDASVCNNSTNFYCWMVCQDIPDSNQAQHHIDQDQSLYCLDPAVLHDTQSLSQAVQSCSDPQTGTSGGAMDDACIGSWQKTSDKTIPSQPIAGTTIHPNNNNHNNNNNNVTPKKMDRPYCFGGTSMLMGGFEWESNTCIVYLFPQWVLSTRTKMIVACIGTFLAGMALEGIIAGRRYVTTQIMVNTNNGTQILLTSAFFYMMQLSLGYLLMLVVMTYSGPLFMSVIIGIISGHVGFNFMGRNSPRKINTFIPEGSTPCCQNDLGGVGPRRLSSSNNHNNTCSPTCDMNHANTTNTTPPTTVCGSDTRPSPTDVEHNFTIDPMTTTTNPLCHDSDDEEFFANLPPCCQPKQQQP